MNLTFAAHAGSRSTALWLARLYKLGTLVLTATGNQFTHDAATFPVTRTQFGIVAQPISLIPIVNVTTVLATTAAQFILQNATGPAAGYVNQDGNSVTGVTTFVFPSATTAARSAFIPMLEQNAGQGSPFDSGVHDISHINVTVASGGSAAAEVWGMEPLAPLNVPLASTGIFLDAIFGGLSMVDLSPAVPTAGTLTSDLAIVAFATGTSSCYGFAEGVLNS